MTTFDAAQMKTSDKMSNLIMEYVSQIIARDFYETYEREALAGKQEALRFTPAPFDEEIYKKITKLIKKRRLRKAVTARFALGLIAAALCIFCVAFTVFVFLNEALRGEVFNVFL